MAKIPESGMKSFFETQRTDGTEMSMHQLSVRSLSLQLLSVNIMGDYIITKSKDVKDGDSEKFFKAAYEFCLDRCGEKNVVRVGISRRSTRNCRRILKKLRGIRLKS